MENGIKIQEPLLLSLASVKYPKGIDPQVWGECNSIGRSVPDIFENDRETSKELWLQKRPGVWPDL